MFWNIDARNKVEATVTHCKNSICRLLKLLEPKPCYVNSLPFPLLYSNNVVLESGDKYSLNDDGSELVIKDVKKVDEGDYTCIARNKAGEKTEEVSLNVFGERISPFLYVRFSFLFSLCCSGPPCRSDSHLQQTLLHSFSIT